MHVLAPEFGLPPKATLRLFRKWRRNVIHIGSNNMLGNYLVETLAKRSFKPHFSDFGKERQRKTNDRNDGYGFIHV